MLYLVTRKFCKLWGEMFIGSHRGIYPNILEAIDRIR